MNTIILMIISIETIPERNEGALTATLSPALADEAIHQVAKTITGPCIRPAHPWDVVYQNLTDHRGLIRPAKKSLPFQGRKKRSSHQDQPPHRSPRRARGPCGRRRRRLLYQSATVALPQWH